MKSVRYPYIVLTLIACMSHWDVCFADAPIILAHRGGAHEYEENTMEGFRTCYEQGIRGYETDIRMTKDGVLVILHDDSLDRTHDATGAIEHKTIEELQGVVTKKGQKLLFLDEFLDYFSDKPGVYIELEMKTSNKKLYPDPRIQEYCQKLHAAAVKKKHKDSEYIFTSFDERPLRAIHEIDPKAPMSLIASKPCSSEFIARAKAVGADRIACQLKGTTRVAVEEAHKNGLKVNCWPGHRVADYFLAIGLGVDVHCTDIPTAVFDVHRRLPDIKN